MQQTCENINLATILVRTPITSNPELEYNPDKSELALDPGGTGPSIGTPPVPILMPMALRLAPSPPAIPPVILAELLALGIMEAPGMPIPSVADEDEAPWAGVVPNRPAVKPPKEKSGSVEGGTLLIS